VTFGIPFGDDNKKSKDKNKDESALGNKQHLQKTTAIATTATATATAKNKNKMRGFFASLRMTSG
jgi:hypothetical protein